MIKMFLGKKNPNFLKNEFLLKVLKYSKILKTENITLFYFLYHHEFPGKK